MTSKNNKSSWVRCPWCGKQPVQTKRGRIVQHLNGAIKCVGSGQILPDVFNPHRQHNKNS